MQAQERWLLPPFRAKAAGIFLGKRMGHSRAQLAFKIDFSANLLLRFLIVHFGFRILDQVNGLCNMDFIDENGI